MNYKQRYEEALERAKYLKENTDSVGAKDISYNFEYIFPELRESEDERIRKSILELVKQSSAILSPMNQKSMISWLEKQGGQGIIDLKEYAKGILKGAAIHLMIWIDENLADGKMCLSNMECEDLADAMVNAKWDKIYKYIKKKVEKQNKQEQLYIHFGEVPTDEKSKIYQGEIKVGTENGVSVYPAFKTDEGNIVLGLTLPITKTTLYTQQHLIEYDDRPCYLVKGDYVGKDTDGQPLINNVSIIEKIDNYRVKEEKQGKQEHIDESKPKFKVGDWITNGEYTWKVTDIKPLDYILQSQNGDVVDDTISYVDEEFHLWTIQDAKDGDVLSQDSIPFIFKSWDNNCIAYCGITGFGLFKVVEDYFSWCNGINVTPATKEQRDLLFQKMKEAYYEWNAEKKELKKIEQKQEWSEEDEKILDSIIEEIRPFGECPDYPTDEDREYYYNRAKMIDWLKSIRPNHWKPSEEQMEALKKRTHGLHTSSETRKALESLINDLKKL